MDNTATHRNQNDSDDGREIPGDTDAPDIVGRTGEEMPDAAHDSGAGQHPDDNETDQTGRAGLEPRPPIKKGARPPIKKEGRPPIEPEGGPSGPPQ